MLDKVMMKMLAGTVAETVHEHVKRQLKPLQDRIAELEDNRLRYVGVYEEDKYLKGEVVTHGGSMWVCRTSMTEGKPGETDDWQLCVKRGRDGRDGRDR